MKLHNLKVFLVLVFFSSILYIGDKQGLLNPIRTISSTIVMPIQYSLYSVKLGLAETFSFLTFWKSGENRIKNLELRNLELLSYEQRAKNLEKENEVLRKQLGISVLATRQVFPATVLFSGAYLEIAGGLLDGVSKGQTVVVFDNFIGRIVRANPRTSLVQLPFDPDAKTPVKVGPAHGLVTGQFNSSMSLERITQNEEINVDDLVLTSGEGGIVPNLIVGRISKIKKAESDLFQTATVVPVINYHDLTTVFVVTN